ncbi:hypothetical protein PMAYCL1PPCAC_31677, partial [Pristionchus mayeri]
CTTLSTLLFQCLSYVMRRENGLEKYRPVLRIVTLRTSSRSIVSECIHGSLELIEHVVRCICDDGYYGVDCSTPCDYGTHNDDGSCDCEPGYQGSHCEFDDICDSFGDKIDADDIAVMFIVDMNSGAVDQFVR